MEDSYKRKIIVNYFKKNLAKGYTPETLRWALVKQGYSRTIVEQSLDVAQKEMADKAPKLVEKPRIIHEIINENDNPVKIKTFFWEKFLGFFKLQNSTRLLMSGGIFSWNSGSFRIEKS